MERSYKDDGMRHWNGYGSLEEDLLEDTEPELVDISLSGSCSSHKSSQMFVPQSTSPRQSSDSDSSVNTCVSPQPVKRRTRNKLSLSLHDISEFPEHGVESLRSKSQSMTMLPSLRQSREAGLPRSISTQSRISSARRYDHVQSRVKEYIRNIKAETARNRKLRASRETLNQVHMEPTKRTEVDELKRKLSDSDLYISLLENNYQELLLKHAAAQKTIDELRIRPQRSAQGQDINKPVIRHAAVQTVTLAPTSPFPKSYTSTLKLKLSPHNSIEVVTNESGSSQEIEGTLPNKHQVDADICYNSLQDDAISKVKRWQDSLSTSPDPSLEQAAETKPADSGYGGSVPNVTEVPPLKLGSLLDSSSQVSSTLSCSMHTSSSSHGDLHSIIAALQSLYDVQDSASTSYRSIMRGETDVQQAIDSFSELNAREICKGHLKLSSKDKRMLFKCLEDLDVFAESVKSRSEALRSILTQRLHSTK